MGRRIFAGEKKASALCVSVFRGHNSEERVRRAIERSCRSVFLSFLLGEEGIHSIAMIIIFPSFPASSSVPYIEHYFSHLCFLVITTAFSFSLLVLRHCCCYTTASYKPGIADCCSVPAITSKLFLAPVCACMWWFTQEKCSGSDGPKTRRLCRQPHHHASSLGRR